MQDFKVHFAFKLLFLFKQANFPTGTWYLQQNTRQIVISSRDQWVVPWTCGKARGGSKNKILTAGFNGTAGIY